MRVLVVDDDPAVLRSLSTALGRDGYEVLAAEDGNAALARLAAANVDAVVLDVWMRALMTTWSSRSPSPNFVPACARSCAATRSATNDSPTRTSCSTSRRRG